MAEDTEMHAATGQPEEIEAQFARISSSDSFRRSERMTRFLRFIVDQALKGSEENLKEYTVGLSVFDRPASFDPQTDSVVRSGARRLRAMLLDYYEGPGREDPVIIDMPKGRYLPVFRLRADAVIDEAGSPPAEHITRRRVLTLSAAVALLIAATIGVWSMPRANSGVEVSSIAVIPFRDSSPNQDQQPLCEGLAETFIHALSGLPNLRVVGPDSTMRKKVDDAGIQELGRQLEVDSVLHGSVQRLEDRLRVWVRLIRVSDGSQILSTSFNREFSESFRLQDELVHTVVTALRAGSGDQPQVRSPMSQTKNMDAWNACLLGQFHYRRYTALDVGKARKYFEQALQLDPNYALAHAGLADVAEFEAADPKRLPEALDEAFRHATKAQSLDPDLAQPQLTLAVERAIRWDWPAAERQFKAVLRRFPDFARARSTYALFYLAPRGQIRDAVAEALRSLQDDPLSPNLYRDYAWMLYFARDNDAAMRAIEKAREIDAAMFVHLHAGKVHLQKAQFAEAERECRWPVRPDPVCIAMAVAKQGRVGEARALIKRVTLDTGFRYSRPERIAEYYAFTGQYDTALDWLERAVNSKSPLVPGALKGEPLYDPLRESERFRALLKRVDGER